MFQAARQSNGTRPQGYFLVERRHPNGKSLCPSPRGRIPYWALFRLLQSGSCGGLTQPLFRPAPSCEVSSKWWYLTGRSLLRVTQSPAQEASASKTIQIKCNMPERGPARAETIPAAPFITPARLGRALVALTRF